MEGHGRICAEGRPAIGAAADLQAGAARVQVGGIASLAAAWILGPRIGRFDSAGNPVGEERDP